MNKLLLFAFVVLVATNPIFSQCPADLAQSLFRAPHVIVGEVVKRGPEPGYWSGQFLAFQPVRYRILENLKGNIPDAQIVVNHLVVKNSPTAASNRSALSSDIFSQHSRLILFIERAKTPNSPTVRWLPDLTVFEAIDERSILSGDPANMARVRLCQQGVSGNDHSLSTFQPKSAFDLAQPEEYWSNAPSTPVRIVVKRGLEADRNDEFFENLSNGMVSEIHLGCVSIAKDAIEMLTNQRVVKVTLSPFASEGSIHVLPKSSRGGALSICSSDSKVTIMEVRFADGGKWTIR